MSSVLRRPSPRVLFVGRTTLDLLYLLDELPVEDTKAYARELRSAPGGPALNAAITHSMLGGSATLISAVGGGRWSVQVREELGRHKIRLLDLGAGTDYETPLVTALVSAARSSRTIVNPPLSTVTLPALPAAWEQAAPDAWGDAPPVILCDGFHLAQTLPLLASCKSSAICLDGGSWKPGTAELAPLLTAAICSERFTIPGEPAGPESIFKWFAARGVPHIAVTRGARPILGWDGGGWDRGRRFEIEIEAIEARDTLGAGDVLHGAFCHYFALGADFESALRKASVVATRSCQSPGIESWAGQA
jgi:sugar/nucleoside kinase (ribokinase family)